MTKIPDDAVKTDEHRRQESLGAPSEHPEKPKDLASVRSLKTGEIQFATRDAVKKSAMKQMKRYSKAMDYLKNR